MGETLSENQLNIAELRGQHAAILFYLRPSYQEDQEMPSTKMPIMLRASFKRRTRAMEDANKLGVAQMGYELFKRGQCAYHCEICDQLFYDR